MNTRFLLLISVLLISLNLRATEVIHVYVALCDNVNQGIVPVPEKIGNGQDPRLNLYWGAGYGVKSFFKYKTDEWELIKTFDSPEEAVLERVVFKHATKDAYMVADAYDGLYIKQCINSMLQASNGLHPKSISVNGTEISIGGGADLIAYVGHNGLMEFEVGPIYQTAPSPAKDVIILACYSRNYFQHHIKSAGANPILWTTHLMAPEAYTLDSAVTDWLNGRSNEEIDENAAQTYNRYQKCGIKGARNLFCTGFK